MVKMSITGFLIALILVSACIASFGLFLNATVTGYGVIYDQNVTEEYNKLTELNQESEELFNATGAIKEQTGVLDKIGALYSSAVSSLGFTRSSFDTFTSVIDTSNKHVPGGGFNPIWKLAIISVVSILLAGAALAFVRGVVSPP